jgi:CBS domain-containing protein
MKVKDIMTTIAQTCRSDNNLAEAAMVMWENDCGIVPVLDGDSKVIGLVTDRDICIAAATKNKAPGDIKINEVLSSNVASCKADDDVKDALKLMQDAKIRRLPVLDDNGSLQGILSLSDVIQSAEDSKKKNSISYKDVVTTLKSICSTEIILLTDEPEIKPKRSAKTIS